MQKSVCEYLVPFSSESVKTSAGCSKKKVTFRIQHLKKMRLKILYVEKMVLDISYGQSAMGGCHKK